MALKATIPAAGEAVKLYVTPPANAVYWRILRKSASAITGVDDSAAVVIAEQTCCEVVLDWEGLENGTAYTYAAFYRVGGEWSVPDTATAVPAASYIGGGIEPVRMILDRLKSGFAAEVAAGTFVTPSGLIDTHANPLMLPDDMTFPCVGVHLDSSGPDEFAIGDVVRPDSDNGDGTVTVWDGTVWTYRLSAVGISLNQEERLALRKVIGRVLSANHEIFELLGLQNMTFSQSDHEDLQQNNAPLYLTTAAISCQAVEWVATVRPQVTSIIIKNHVRGYHS